MAQTESVQFKLDGLVLAIEGLDQIKADAKLAVQALGLISFDDETETHKIRALNDGRSLETEVELDSGGNSISWELALGGFKTRTAMRINEKGEWTGLGELVIATARCRKWWI